MKKANFHDIQAQVIAKIWKDPEFKKKFLHDPIGVLKEMGVHFPANFKVKVHEDAPHTLTFVIPPKPSHTEELTEKEMLLMAGGSGCCVTEYITITFN
jgi:hypothetical protein